MTPARVEWDDALGTSTLREALGGEGIAWVRAPALVDLAERDPWAAAERLLGEPPVLVERQPIRAVTGGRSFASGRMAAPFHSDSQLVFGVPPHVQVMACRRPAERGGECLYVDTWPLLDRIAAEDRLLYGALFTQARRLPFVFGDVFGPTVSVRGGSVVISHSARPRPGDAVAARLQAFVDGAPVIAIRAEAGDVVAIHNHRFLHGRRAFEDERRSFTRLLAWRPGSLPAPPHLRARAMDARVALDAAMRDAPPAVRTAFGIDTGWSGEAWARLAPVLALLRGVPAGMVSARNGLPEHELYARREAVLRAALGAPQHGPGEGPGGAAAWLDRLHA